MMKDLKNYNLLLATGVLVVGVLAILTQFPTRDGSSALAGALFGAGASFIGAWATERNRLSAEREAVLRLETSARNYFSPELARVVSHQIYVLNRVSTNFVMASVKKSMPQVETWESFRAQAPILYPTAAQFKDLSEANATSLINFYDSLQGIVDILTTWVETRQSQEDFNSWNFLLQTMVENLRVARLAIEQLCPERQYSPIMPASGTLLENIDRALSMSQECLDAHISRQIQ